MGLPSHPTLFPPHPDTHTSWQGLVWGLAAKLKKMRRDEKKEKIQNMGVDLGFVWKTGQ